MKALFKRFVKRWKKKKTEQNEWRKKDFHIGDVVQTKDGHDRGLVTKVDENNMPAEVMAAPGMNMRTGENTEIRYYGGIHSVVWYKTGEHMTSKQWYKTYSAKEGWQRYCEDRKIAIKFIEED